MIENQRQFSDFYEKLTFGDPSLLREALAERKRLLDKLDGRVRWGYHGTKADCSNLSPGCRHCGNGSWSCLFINGMCNANCFYCPAPQNQQDPPTTQTVAFPKVEDYIAYLCKFGYKGVSISGGEPLMDFEKTLEFITRIRQSMGEEVYLWLYTNGILLDEDKLRLLRNARLNEIRLDIGATQYATDRVEMAMKWIPAVTVEIPAVPEEFDRMKLLLHHFDRIGLHYLNLHQIRCTPHNYPKLLKRGYTFLHGPQITVMESELTALKLMVYACENGLQVPLNYCSSIYKYRYQRMAARRKFAPLIAHNYEEITETGMIRSLSVLGDKADIDPLYHRLLQATTHSDDCYRPEGTSKIYFKKHLWKHIDFSNLQLAVSYSRAFLLPEISYRNMFTEVRLNSTKKVVVERMPIYRDCRFMGAEIRWYGRLFMEDPHKACCLEDLPLLSKKGESGTEQPDYKEMMARFFECEKLSDGLPGYY